MFPEIISFNLPFLTNPVTIYTYGLMIAIGFLIATIVTVYRSKHYNIDKNIVYDAIFYMILSGIIGARVLFILVNWESYILNPIEIFYVHEGGLVFYGGFLGGIIALYFYFKIKKLELFNFTDLLAPQIALAHAFGRIGCFAYGCCFGKSIDLGFLSITFPESSPAYSYHLFNNLIDSTHSCSLPVVNVQLIESFFLFFLFIFLIIISKKVASKGFLTAYYFMLYPFFRFIIEFFRGDFRGSYFLGLISVSQLISLLLFVMGINMYFLFKRNSKKS